MTRQHDADKIRAAAEFLHKISLLGLYSFDLERAKGFAVELDGIVLAGGLEALQNTSGKPVTDEPGWEGCVW